MKKILVCAIGVLLLGIGCARTVYVPYGQAVRLRESVKDVKIWAKTANGEVPGKVTLHEGWFCLPYTEEEE